MTRTMPELPEVETIVRRFQHRLEGRTILGFTARWPRQTQPAPARLRARIRGKRIAALRRRGKHIVFDLSDGSCLTVHLKMSGRFEWSGDHVVEPPHVRAIFRLSGQRSLWFVDARKFGRIRHAARAEDLLGHLGPEPLAADFDARRLRDLLAGRRGRLKPLLLDQSRLAGLGNIYCDESLHRAGLHPLRRADSLSWAEIKGLHRAIRQVLREAIRANGTSLDWIYPQGNMQDYLRVYGRTGQACPRCQRAITRLVVAGRATHLCPTCQPPGRAP